MDSLPDDAPAPRLCHLIKWPDFDGYGFNLHAERSNPGQFVGKIDDDSPAQMAGLREGDRIVEVNGVNISEETHRQVVERIKSDPQQTKLLVVDQETDLWYKEQDLVVKSTQLNVVYVKTPIPRPQPDSPRAKFHQPVVDEPQQVSSLSPSAIGSSLTETTSDFNDDSIEQQPAASSQPQQDDTSKAQVVGDKVRSSPPMSPDSGKGDEEPPTANVLTIEAEINRQSPQKMLQVEDQAVDTEDQVLAVRRDDEQEALVVAVAKQQDQTITSIQPDSLSQQQVKQTNGGSMSPSDSADQQQVSLSVCVCACGCELLRDREAVVLQFLAAFDWQMFV